VICGLLMVATTIVAARTVRGEAAPVLIRTPPT